MRRYALFLVAIMGLAASFLIPARAHYAGGDTIVFPGATPRTLCYKLEKDVADNPLWAAWVQLAFDAWEKANTGWHFKKCDEKDKDTKPDITIGFNHETNKVPGGAKGGGSSIK